MAPRWMVVIGAMELSAVQSDGDAVVGAAEGLEGIVAVEDAVEEVGAVEGGDAVEGLRSQFWQGQA